MRLELVLRPSSPLAADRVESVLRAVHADSTRERLDFRFASPPFHDLRVKPFPLEGDLARFTHLELAATFFTHDEARASTDLVLSLVRALDLRVFEVGSDLALDPVELALRVNELARSARRRRLSRHATAIGGCVLLTLGFWLFVNHAAVSSAAELADEARARGGRLLGFVLLGLGVVLSFQAFSARD